MVLHVEYAGRGRKYGFLFIYNLFYEYIHLDYVRVPVVNRVHQVEYGVHILVVASQEYANTYSTRRVMVDKVSIHTLPFTDGVCIPSTRAHAQETLTRNQSP